MIRKRFFLMVLLVCVLMATLLGACAGSETPQQIASYPSRDGEVTTYQPAQPIEIGRLTVVYNAYMEMEVWDVEKAADEAISIAFDHGGYLASSQSWRQDAKGYTRLTLHVPAERYEAVHRRLLKLGTLTHERVSGALLPGGRRDSDWENYSEITLHLQPRTATFPWVRLPAMDWRPVRTFASAFRLFASIFGFLVDVLIWITVIVGPFLLMGLGLRWLVRRGTKR